MLGYRSLDYSHLTALFIIFDFTFLSI